MDVSALIPYWGALVGFLLIAIVLARYWIAALQGSAWGQLRQAVSVLRAAKRARERAAQQIASAEQRVRKMEHHPERVKPRLLTEARGALDDAKVLAKIADDKWMIAANHVRRVIVEEYPPHRHARLRERYLPDDSPNGRPFSF